MGSNPTLTAITKSIAYSEKTPFHRAKSDKQLYHEAWRSICIAAIAGTAKQDIQRKSVLAMAKAAPPLRRKTADRLITEVINRACAVNGNESWAYRVGRLVVFGSCA